MKINDIFKTLVNVVVAFPKAYENSMNEYYRQVKELPPQTQAYLHAAMHIRR